MLPIVYTPTVGEAVQQFNFLYQSARGLSLSPLQHRSRAAQPCKNYTLERRAHDRRHRRQRHPRHRRPGLRRPRHPHRQARALHRRWRRRRRSTRCRSRSTSAPIAPTSSTTRSTSACASGACAATRTSTFIDKFVDAVNDALSARGHPVGGPGEGRRLRRARALSQEAALVQRRHPGHRRRRARRAHQRVRAARRAAARSDASLVYGAGAGGCGVAWAIRKGMVRDGLSADEARARVLVLDSKGLLDERPLDGAVQEACTRRIRRASPAGRSRGTVPSLLETIENARPTALLGLSGQPRAFTEPVVRAMVAANDEARPIVFPLSNPTSSCEALPEELIEWTEGRAIVATGSPFAPVRLPRQDLHGGAGQQRVHLPGARLRRHLVRGERDHRRHGAGGGLRARRLRAREAACRKGDIYPAVDELNDVSMRVATRVLEQAFDDGVAHDDEGDARGRRRLRARQVLEGEVPTDRPRLTGARRLLT